MGDDAGPGCARHERLPALRTRTSWAFDRNRYSAMKSGFRDSVVFAPPEPKTVKIPIRVRSGRIGFLYGGRLPKMRDGTVGDLTYAAAPRRLCHMVAPPE